MRSRRFAGALQNSPESIKSLLVYRLSLGYLAGMRFSAADSDGGHLILGYGPGRILIGGRTYTRGLIVSPERIDTDWGPENAIDLAAKHFDALLALDPQIIIIGTGKHQIFPDPNTYLTALQQGLGVDIMDTGAACRTYNILVSEGRKVVAGLIMCRDMANPF